MGFGWAPRELLVGRKPEHSCWKGSSGRAEGTLSHLREENVLPPRNSQP